LDPAEYVLPEGGDRIQSPKRCDLKHKQDDILDKDQTMDNVQEPNICTNLPSSENFRSYLQQRVKTVLAATTFDTRLT
jgi:hypothetical protein